MNRRISVVLAVATLLFVVGCSADDSPSPDAIDEQSTVTAIHEAQSLTVGFIKDVQANRYADSPVEFPSDFELSPQDRIAAFRILERHIKSDTWTPAYTVIAVVDGREDSVDVYLRSSTDGWLALMYGYDYDSREWKIGAYEIPDRSFSRPKNETFGEYMTRCIRESKASAKPYTVGTKADGDYFIE